MSSKEKLSKALWFAAVRDATDIIEIIPVVGDTLGDIIEDISMKQIRETLSPEELKEYIETSQIIPEVPSMLKTLKVPPPSPIKIEKEMETKGWFPLPPSPLRVLKEKGWPIP